MTAWCLVGWAEPKTLNEKKSSVFFILPKNFGFILKKSSLVWFVDLIKGVPSAKSSHTRWGMGKRISRQPYPSIIIL